ncbi:hypothetical protein M9458_048652, partial [Cirrhinus mrigala]
MWCKDEDDLFLRRDRDKINRHVRIELPPPFSGDEKQSFLCWAQQFEVSVRALTEGDGVASYNYELARILPTRLSNAAFLLWDSLPRTVQADYAAVKGRLKEAFGQRQFMDRFRASLSARPRAPRESLEVYVAEISRLVDEAFPEYGDRAQREEKFRRFLAFSSVLGEAAHLRGNCSPTVMSILQAWMFVVLKTLALLCHLQDAAPAPVLADGTAMRMIQESGDGAPLPAGKRTVADVAAQTPAMLPMGPQIDMVDDCNSVLKNNDVMDSGSSVSLMSADFRMSIPTLRNRPLKKDYVSAHAVNGQMLDTLGTITVTFQLGTESWQHVFHVLRKTTQTVLLGWDFLLKNHALLDLSRAELQLWDVTVPLLTSKDFVPTCCNVSLATTINLPPLSESVVPVKVYLPNTTHVASDFVGYLEPNVADSSSLIVAHTVAGVHNGLTKARILNPTGHDISLKQGMHLGELYSVDDCDVQLFQAPADVAAVTSASAAPPVSLDESPISDSEKAALSKLLLEFNDIFSSSKQNDGKCKLVKHYIRTGEQAPIKLRAHRTSPEKRAEIERQVAGLLADGVIEESCSPWASPVVLVRKKYGTWRFCVDYRRLNSVTIKDSHPLPRVDDTLDALAGAVWFSTLDFSNGYWQVEVVEEDREKIAFTTGQDLYQWRSMPVGLSNAPATFQRLMELVLRGLP